MATIYALSLLIICLVAVFFFTGLLMLMLYIFGWLILKIMGR